MALSSGAGLHQAWIAFSGGKFLLDQGSVEQHADNKDSTFGVSLPMDEGGAESAFAALGDNTATISCVTRGISGTLLVGEIDRVVFDYTQRRIHASGRGLGAKLNELKSSENWTNKNGSEIVQQLAGEAGLGFKGDSSTVKAGKQLTDEHVKLSDNVTFAYVINKCAEMDGAHWWVDNDGVLNYFIDSSPGGTYTVNYKFVGIEVISDSERLRVDLNVQARKSVEVQVQSYHSYDKKVYNGKFTQGGIGGPIVHKFHIPELKQDQADRFAESRAKEVGRHRLKIDATVPGDPSCNVNMKLSLNGTAFAGTYIMDIVTHHLGMSGHTTHITARSLDGEDSQSGTGDASGTGGLDGQGQDSVAAGGAAIP